LSKESATLDLWCRETAPSTVLRKWFTHEASRWEEFIQRYTAELDQQPESVDKLKIIAQKIGLTLLFSAFNQKIEQCRGLESLLRTDIQMSLKVNGCQAPHE